MREHDEQARHRTWLVTGVSSGFGRALSEAVLARGDRLVVTTRVAKAAKPLVDRAPERVLAIPLDITDAAACRDAVKAAHSRFGSLDILVNNAGYAHGGAVEELGDDELRRQMDVNFFGVVHMTRAVLPVMREQRSGHIIQMSSLNGVEGMPGGGYYAASKFAVEGLSESLADEVAHLGIKVTIVEPGPHRTRFAARGSMRWAEPMDDYAASVGQVRQAVAHLDGNQPGDPRRAADAIIRIAGTEAPPRRLPLGRFAVDHIRTRLDGHRKELESWAGLSLTSDFPG